MRKIWSSRKDKDKRKSIVTSNLEKGDHYSEKPVSTSDLKGASAYNVSSDNSRQDQNFESRGVKKRNEIDIVDSHDASISSLIKPGYDNRVFKNSWVNMVSNQSNEITENNMRLLRAELKGSHLYLYKAHTLNASSFKLIKAENDTASFVSSIPTDRLRMNSSTPSLTAPVKKSLSFLKTDQTHPNLAYDFENHCFLKGSNVDALLHFILFNYDEEDRSNIEELISLLPLFPRFEGILDTLASTMELIFSKQFNETFNKSILLSRILELLKVIESNFYGFFLKTDTASNTVKLLEILSNNTTKDDQILQDIVVIKEAILKRQQSVLDLIAIRDHDDSDNLSLDPVTFLYHTNLITLANSINSVDLQFFKVWNSSMDKSLLLSSIVSDASPDLLYKRNSLFFDNRYHIHYLGRLFINHLFVDQNDFSVEKLARLVEKWIDLGCLLEKLGNISAWLGIASIILSPPILRLGKLWTLVSHDYIKLLKNDWSPVLFELDKRYILDTEVKLQSTSESSISGGPAFLDPVFHPTRNSYHIMAPRGIGKIYKKENCIPYFGDLKYANASADIDDIRSVWRKVQYSFNRWSDYLSGLKNQEEIIQYNQDILKRYDDMCYIFSNESLNHVLYLGVSESKNKPVLDKLTNSHLIIDSDKRIERFLFKLIELNCDSINLDRIMKYSLILEPASPEAYVAHDSNTEKIDNLTLHSSSMSLHSNESFTSYNKTLTDTASLSTQSPDQTLNSLPHFNNDYFKIKIEKYDELYGGEDQVLNLMNSNTLDSTIMKHFFVVDKDLIFRVDDFITDSDTSLLNLNLMSGLDDIDTLDGEADDDTPGLSIDVDALLESSNIDSPHIEREPLGGSISPDFTKNKNNLRQSLVSNDSNGSKYNLFYIPKYASVDKLIDLLLIDSKYFNKNIALNLSEFRVVFLLSYNSFMSTKELLEGLIKRFTDSGNAVISIMRMEHTLKTGEVNISSNEVFPNWNDDPSVNFDELGEIDYELLLKIQINIIKLVILLLNNFHTNITSHIQNQKLFIQLIKLFGNELMQWYNSNKIDSKIESTFGSLINYYKKMKRLFVKKTYRPIEMSKFERFLKDEFKFSNVLSEVPVNRNLPSHKNIPKVEKFILKFNKLLTLFYKGIRSDDWFHVYNILEYQFESKNIFNFNLQAPTVGDDNMIISNIFNFLETLISSDQKQLTLKQFPVVFRKLFKLYFKFRTYILLQLTDPGISNEERLDRMKTVLLMLKICKTKMNDNQFVFEGKEGNIPSTIETALVNAVYMPESRRMANMWIKASKGFKTKAKLVYEDINSLLPDLTGDYELSNGGPLLPCFGWIIENLLSVITCPNYFKSLINFNKRYLIYKIVMELSIEDDETDLCDDMSPLESKEFEFLLGLDESLLWTRSIKVSSQENKDNKLFRAVIRRQQYILATDSKKKISKEAYAEMHSIIPQSSSIQTLNKKGSNSSLKRQSFSYKSNSGSRFKISGLFGKPRAFALNNPPSVDKTIASNELPDVSIHTDIKQKPYLVLSLKDVKIFPVYLLAYSFKIDSEATREDFFFQATGESELNDWLKKLNYNSKHWYFSKSLNLAVGEKVTFGIPIELVCKRDKSDIPLFLSEIFEAIEIDGINDVGIYRISTSISDLNNIKSSIDKQGSLNFNDRSYSPHGLASCVKSYFRELPEPLLTDEAIISLIDTKEGLQKLDDKKAFDSYAKALSCLPKVNYNTLKALLYHLSKVNDLSENNKMTASNLATVIGPALTEASNLDSLINNFGYINLAIEKMILNFEGIFDDMTHTVDNKSIVTNGIMDKASSHFNPSQGTAYSLPNVSAEKEAP